MTTADLSDIATLELGGRRGPNEWIDWNLRNYRDHGFGLWVIETHDGDFIGDCGLTLQDVEGESLVEVGWHVRAGSRRRGYATEAAAAVRAAAARHGVQHLIALIGPTNVASQRVAANIGLTFEREVARHGMRTMVFGAVLSP